MLERFENCESVFIEKADATDFSRFTPAIVRKPDDLKFPPFVTDYFEKEGRLERLPILPERGNPSGVEVGDILRLFGENWLREHGVSKEQGKVISRLSACRTHVLGGHVEQCDTCGYLRNAYNSCRDRHCPKCQGMAKEKWVEARKAELLPCGYFHEVFTLPHLLNPLILCNRKLLLNLLFETVNAVLAEFAADPRWRLNGSIGFIAILHTWSQTILDHFHLHCVVPGGALSFDGKKWTPANEKFLFSSKALAKRFKKRFIDALTELYENGELEFAGKAISMKSKKGFKTLIRKLWQKEWIVYSKAPFGGPEAVLEYIGRYTHRVAISNNRIVSLKDGKVTFTYRDRQDNNELKEMTVDVDEFIRRFLLHVLPERFVKIRYFGFLSHRVKKESVERIRSLADPDFEPPETREETAEETREETAEETMSRLIGEDVCLCPKCRKGRMTKILELPKPKIMQRRVRIVVIDSS